MADEERRPSEEDLLKLSLRGIVAYAARCALRVWPLFFSDDEKSVHTVRQAVEHAVIFPKNGCSPLTIKSLAASAHVAANDALNNVGKADDPRAADYLSASHAAGAAANAADAAAAALDGETKDSRSASHAAAFFAVAATFNSSKAKQTRDATDALLADYKTLLQLAHNPAPALGEPIDFDRELGPLWLNGEPEWYTEAVAKPRERKVKGEGVITTDATGKLDVEQEAPEPTPSIRFTIEFPEDVSEEQAEEIAREVALKANALHRAMGGPGLTVRDLDAFAAPAGVGVKPHE